MKTRRFTSRDLEEICKAESVAAFLSLFIRQGGLSLAPMSYAEVARRIGSRSRAFPRELCSGRRRLTRRFFSPMVKCLRIPTEIAKVLECLMQREDTDLNQQSAATLESALQKARRRLTQKQLSLTASPHLALTGFTELDLPRTYAALGSQDEGASLPEIAERLGKNQTHTAAALKRLIGAELVTWSQQSDRYYANASNVYIPNSGDKEFFKRHFKHSSESAIRASIHQMGSEESLFFTSSICVNKKLLKEMKAALRKVIFDFVAEHEAPHGDKIVEINLALFS